MEFLTYPFMRRALVVALFVGAATASLGQVIVLRRQANIGDALAHSALAGVALGVLLGQSPLLFSTIATLLAALAIMILQKAFPRYGEVATAVVLSLAVGLAAIFSSHAGAGKSFQSYLFGSIIAISQSEMHFIIIASSLSILLSLACQKELFYLTFDPPAARKAGVKQELIEPLFVLLTALTVSIGSRTVGSLIISSLLLLPYAAAMQLGLNYQKTLWAAIFIGVFDAVVGLVISYYLNFAPGGSIVVLAVIVLIICTGISQLKSPAKISH